MRLIDADELVSDLLDQIPNAENVHIFKDIIDSQKTAYDVEKVSECLGYNKAIDKMKAIVKKHENTEKVQTVREICGNRRYYRAISVSKFCRLADKLKEDNNTKSEKCKYWNAEHEDCALNTDVIYDNAIDDFLYSLKKYMENTEKSTYIEELNKGNETYSSMPIYNDVVDIAEQLKKGE